MKFAALAPEIYCLNFSRSFDFYTDRLGFSVVYYTPEDKFAYLERQGAQIMIQELTAENEWLSEKPVYPFGRGINFKIYTSDILALYKTLKESDHSFLQDAKDDWYRKGDVYTGNRQFVIQDPDGYVLRFAEDLGTRTNA